ncbi:MAG: ABC transporter ATP-binding protein [Tepidisphaeraceae bacterium]|jgi:ABC-type lipoprotein export system ATPase subunit
MSRLAEQPASSSAGRDALLLVASGVRKSYRMGDSDLQVLRRVDLSVKAGEFIAIEGRSGSGKSTLLHILGALESYDAGSVSFDGQDFSRFSSAQRSALRNRQFGFVFQFYYLLPELNVLENTMLAAMVEHSWLSFHASKGSLKRHAVDLLKRLGLEERLRHRPQQLSGGERQRVAIARALMNQPRVLFADEPTGNLDFDTGRQIMNVLERLHRQANQTIIMVTHDRSLARQADRILVLKNGALEPAQA